MDQAQSSQSPPAVHFDVYRLDYTNEQLWRGEQLVRLTGKSFTTLCYLIDHAGQLVRKDDLFQGVWPGTVVSDSTLTSCIKELRKALIDDAKAPRYIETIPGQGYRFIAPIRLAQATYETQASNGSLDSGLGVTNGFRAVSSAPEDYTSSGRRIGATSAARWGRKSSSRWSRTRRAPAAARCS